MSSFFVALKSHGRKIPLIPLYMYLSILFSLLSLIKKIKKDLFGVVKRAYAFFNTLIILGNEGK